MAEDVQKIIRDACYDGLSAKPIVAAHYAVVRLECVEDKSAKPICAPMVPLDAVDPRPLTETPKPILAPVCPPMVPQLPSQGTKQ